jgi:predicted permease
MSRVLRIYRVLAGAFPHEFKLAYGPDVLRLGEDVVDEIARRHGLAGLLRLIADLAIRVPIEYLAEMRRDLRYAVRAMLRSPGFASVGILSTGIAMGLTTLVYSSKWKLIMQPLPAASNASRLVMPQRPVAYPTIEQFRGQKSLFTGVAALETGVPFNVTFQGSRNAKPQRVFGQLVSADYFSVLGVRAQRGRVLSAQIDRSGDAPVVVVTDRFWRNRLNASPEVIGQTLRLNGQPATIVGVTPKHFNGALAFTPAELFVPIHVPASLAPELANDVLHQSRARDFLALVCLAPGVRMDTAEAALDTITRRLDRQDPTAPPPAAKGRRVTLLSAGTMVPLPRNLKSVLAGFYAVLMGLIMLIACMNLANMQLARGANRRKELAIRRAVGAGRFRIVRQMVSEGILLSLLGGIAGFALAYGLSVLNARVHLPTAVPIESDLTPDWRAALFVFALAIVCGIGFSLVPALRATKADLTPALKEGSGQPMRGFLRLGLRNILMVAQVTGSLMLLLITGFLVIGISHVSGIQTKFDPRTMYLLSLDPVRDGYSPEQARALFEKLPERLGTAGAVASVAVAAQAPFSLEDATQPVSSEDAREASGVQISAVEDAISAGYFAALGEPMMAGREFAELDLRNRGDESRMLPAILNESAARRFFGSANAIGRHIRDENRSYEVVGLVHDLKNGIGISQSVIYVPLTQRNFARPPADGLTIMVRSDAGRDALPSLEGVIASLDPPVTVIRARTLNDYLAQSRSTARLALDTYAGIGVFGLLLAAVGLAGVTAYSVAQRQKEIGIRMALGARKGQVLRLVLREGTALVIAGTAFGFLGAFGLARALSAAASIFVEAVRTGTDDPRLLVGAPLLLAGLALLACYVPARRAAKIDPLRALREG